MSLIFSMIILFSSNVSAKKYTISVVDDKTLEIVARGLLTEIGRFTLKADETTIEIQDELLNGGYTRNFGYYKMTKCIKPNKHQTDGLILLERTGGDSSQGINKLQALKPKQLSAKLNEGSAQIRAGKAWFNTEDGFNKKLDKPKYNPNIKKPVHGTTRSARKKFQQQQKIWNANYKLKPQQMTYILPITRRNAKSQYFDEYDYEDDFEDEYVESGNYESENSEDLLWSLGVLFMGIAVFCIIGICALVVGCIGGYMFRGFQKNGKYDQEVQSVSEC